ncbi:zinc ribbon domain-containing protein [Butyrivibrio sp. XBB1001]|uniref:zinc ribbon domain-containing protein n=1 Tax=Butyrivibrio sp. XBB1001 TaxID=1280682 RepID=UPI00041D52F1|nr:zinc-ribbon domain-containing protein [Butyrivibrio sp. XBB1001]
MFCTNCGAEILPGQTFCTNCGEAVTGGNDGNTGYGNNYGGSVYDNSQAGAYYNNAQQASPVTPSYQYTDSNVYNTGTYGTSTYGAQAYSTPVYNAPVYNNPVVKPKKMGTGILAIAICVAILGGITYGYTHLPSLLGGNKSSGAEPDPAPVSVAAASTEEPDEINEIDNNNGDQDKVEVASGTDATTDDQNTVPASSGGYSTMKKTDGTSTEFAEVDAKGYAETDFSGYGKMEYEFATAYMGTDEYIFVPNGKLNGDTLIRDKKLSEFCDYVDTKLPSSVGKLDRELFYKVLAADIVDSSLGAADDVYLAQSLMYALTFAVNFSDMQVDLNYVRILNGATTRYYYNVSVFGNDDIWMIDYKNKLCYMNKGTTEYNDHGDFALFSDESYGLYILLGMSYFGLEIK